MVAFARTAIAVAHCRPHPVDSRTTTAEQKVVVELVFLGRWALERRAFDAKYDGIISGRNEDMAAKPVRSIFPAKGKALFGHDQRRCHEFIHLKSAE